MKEKIEKGKLFVKEHKKEIAAGLMVAVSGGILFVATKKTPKIKVEKAVELMPNLSTELEHPNLDVGTITDFWMEGGYKNAIVNNLTIADLGVLGEQFKKVDGVTDKTSVSLVMGLLDEVES